MKKFTITTIIATLIISLFIGLSSCTNTEDGTYQVYKVQSSGVYQDSIGESLKSRLQGTIYDVKFHDKYVSLTSHRTKKEMLLATETLGGRDPFYMLTMKAHDTSYTLKLTRDSTIKMDVSMFIQTGLWPPGTSINTSASGPPGRGSSVTCYLSKKRRLSTSLSYAILSRIRLLK